MSIVQNVLGVGWLGVIGPYVPDMLLKAGLQVPASLTHIWEVVCFTCQAVDATFVVGRDVQFKFFILYALHIQNGQRPLASPLHFPSLCLASCLPFLRSTDGRSLSNFRAVILVEDIAFSLQHINKTQCIYSTVWHNYCYSTIGYKFRPQKAIIRPIFTRKLKMPMYIVQYINGNFMGSIYSH